MASTEPKTLKDVSTSAKSAPPKGASRRRAQDFRQKKGDETVDALHKSLNDKLFIGSGFVTAATFLNNLDLSTTEEAVRISVSTRGIGFMIAILWNRLKNQFGERFTRLGDVNSILRATLSQLAYQLQVIATAQQKSTMEANNRADPLAFELAEAIKMNPVNFSPLADIINCVGNLRQADCQFYPNTNNFPTMDPTRVTIQNLRANVVALSAIQTPRDAREYFFQRSAIPGAIWNVTEQVGPVITNPDDIMPANNFGLGYSAAMCRRDLAALKNCLDFACRKYPKLRGECTYSVEGSLGLLVCSEVTEGQTMSVGNDVLDPTIGSDLYWQIRALPPAHYAAGVLCLYGESKGIDEFERTRYYGGGTRSGFVSWSNVATGLVSSLM